MSLSVSSSVQLWMFSGLCCDWTNFFPVCMQTETLEALVNTYEPRYTGNYYFPLPLMQVLLCLKQL